MHFWTGPERIQPELVSLLWLGVFLLGARLLSKSIPAIRRLAIPDALTAGAIGMVLGGSALNVIALDEQTLKFVVYHGGALIFLTLALRTPDQSGVKTGPAVRSYAFAIPFFATIQAILGLGLVWLLGQHLGFGLMLPLGFSQGPGVALAMGDAWEATAGMPDGGQIGLMMSGLGFGFCCLFGVTLFHTAKHKGWLHASEHLASGQPKTQDTEAPEPEAGELDPLTFHFVLIGLVYILTFGVLVGLSEWVGDKPKIVAQLWGFHFLFALGLAVLVRIIMQRGGHARSVHNPTLNRIAGLVVDLTACAAVSAIRLDLLAKYWEVLVVMALVGALVTAVICLWLAKRAFFYQPFEEILVMFGALTGTLPTGLTLLRLADPKMSSTVAPSYVMGSGASVLPAIVLLGLLPTVVAHPDKLLMWIGILGAYALFLVALWWKIGGLRFIRPWNRFWPDVHPRSEQ